MTNHAFNYQLLLITRNIQLAVKLDEALKAPAPQAYSLYIAQDAESAQKDLTVRNFDAVIADPASLKLTASHIIKTVKKIKPESAIILIGENFSSEAESDAAYGLGAQLCVCAEKIGAEELILKIKHAISRQKHFNSALKDAEKAVEAKSRFLAVMSHEIKTPMTSIVGMSDLIRKTVLTSEQLEYVDIINKSCEYLLKIINDILDVSKLESGNLTISQNSFTIDEIVKSAHEMLLVKAREKNIDFTCSIARDITEKFTGDSLRIRQVLINLCSNAIKYTDKGGVSLTVKTVSAKPDSVKLSFEIADTGIGIEAEKQKELFMPYYQIEDTGLLKKEGHGLGLVISKKIIELMNGNLYFESRHQKGSKFWFILELKKSCENTAPGVMLSPAEADTKIQSSQADTTFAFDENFSVLITEDNSFNQKLIHSFLIKKGVKKIEMAINGEECFNICKRQRISAVIMDCQMPVMDGITAAALIREYERSAGKPRCAIIALTADTVYGTREKCIRAGMDDYLTKPIDFDSLYGKLIKISAGENAKNWSENKMNKEEPLQQEKSEIIKKESEELVFDPKLISELKKLQLPGKPDIICQLFTIYLKETDAKIESLKASIKEGAAESIRHIAHNLKSSTANVGGTKLSSIFKTIEAKAKNNEIENLEAFIPEIDSNYKFLNEKLRLLIDGKEML